jgi:hypothetical protein
MVIELNPESRQQQPARERCISRPRSSAQEQFPLQAAALKAAAAGLYVFPVLPFSKTPAEPDWEHVATTVPAQIESWWTARPFNIGVATGPSGLLVVDIDVGHGEPAPPRWAGARTGWDVLARLADAAGQSLPTHTFTVATPSGGRHLYFRQPPGCRLRNTQGERGHGLGWNIDTRGHGGFVVAAGSRAPAQQGRGQEQRVPATYTVVAAAEIASLPAWLATALTPPPEPELRPPVSGAGRVPAGRVTAYVDAVVRGEAAAVGAATVGSRHSVLLAAALKLGNWVGGGLLTEDAAVAALLTAAEHYIGIGGYTRRKVITTIADGIDYGRRRPRGADTIPDHGR